MISIKEHIEAVKAKKLDLIEFTNNTIQKFQELNKEYNAFSIISEELARECAREVQEKINDPSFDNEKLTLAGLPVSIKDCICVKDVESTATSKILKGYEPVFDAAVIKNLKEAGAIIIGKTIQDEFGFGSFSTNVGIDYPVPLNPNSKECATGGSSGGCASATALAIQSDIPHISIAESTGGSIENPASFCGVIGFCPTYGRVSRNGLMSYSNSLDKIGIMSEKIQDTALGFQVISGKDNNDSTSLTNAKYDGAYSEQETEKFKVGIIKESMTDDVNPEIKEKINKTIERLKEAGAIVEEVSLPFTFEYGIPAYYIIAMSEASTNLSCLAGLRYGAQDIKQDEHFSDYFSRIRSENFGKEAKRRIMLGTFTRMAGYRDAFYIKAAKARTTVIGEYKNLFKNYDVLISPTMPFTAPKFTDIEKLRPIDHYLADIMTVGPNLAGIPHMSFPVGKDNNNMPIGMMVMADHFKESVLFKFGEILEQFKNGGNE